MLQHLLPLSFKGESMKLLKTTTLIFCLLLINIAVQAQEQIHPKVAFIEIDPYRIELKPGETYQFGAKLYAPDGTEVNAPYEWASDVGQITQTGLYRAGEDEGIHSVSVIYPPTGMRVASCIFIDDENPNTHSELAVAHYLIMQPQNTVVPVGGTVQFYVRAVNANSMPLKRHPVQWEVSGGTIDNEGRYTAGDTPGIFEIRATTYNSIQPMIVDRVFLSTSAVINIRTKAELGPHIAVEFWNLVVQHTAHFHAQGRVYGQNAKTLEVYVSPEKVNQFTKIYTAPVEDGTRFNIEATFKALFMTHNVELRLIDAEGNTLTSVHR